jgi:cell division protein ZapB
MNDSIKTSDAPSSVPSAAKSSERSAIAVPTRVSRPHQLDLELMRLSKRIEELVATVEHLTEENRALRQRHESLATERASLLQKNEQVRTRVEAMIGRLKTLEHGA